MGVSILRAFRGREGDEDRFSKWLRVLKATYGAVLFGSVVLMLLSAWYVGYEGRSLSHVLIRVMFPSIIMFLVLGSDITVFRVNLPAPVSNAATRKSYLAPPVLLSASAVAFLILAVEAATFLNSWDLNDMLVWWRRALLVLSAGWLFLCAVETTVHCLRSKFGNGIPRR